MQAIDIQDIPASTRAILIDLDNTLYDYQPCHEHALRHCHELFSRTVEQVSFEEFASLYAAGRKAVKEHNAGTVGSRSRHLYFQRLFEQKFGASRIADALALGDAYWSAFVAQMQLRPWVVPLLEAARERGMRVVVITNLESSLQYQKLLRLGVAQQIDFIVTSEEAGIEKPDQKIFALALAKIGMKPAEAVMIGDDPEDQQGAEGIGIPYIACGS